MATLKKESTTFSPISLLPFICLITIGLWRGEITYHQKIFKTYLIMWFNLILIVSFIIYYLSNHKKREFEIKGIYLAYFLLYFMYILIQFIVSFLTEAISYDREYYLGNYTFLIIFSLFFYLYLKDLKDVEVGLVLINVFFLIVIFWSIYEFNKAGGKFDRFRPKLSFGNTNYFAGYTIGLMPLGFASSILFYNTKKKWYQNILSISSLVIVGLGVIPLIFTQTRAAHFGWFIGTFLIFIPSLLFLIEKLPLSKRLILIGTYFAVIFLTVFILLRFPPQFLEKILQRILKTLRNPEFFLNDRYNGWAGGINLFKKYPIFGAGLGTVYAASFKYIHKYFYLYSKSNSFKHSHNEFVEALGEGGIIGMALFVFLFMFIIVMMLKRTYSNKYKFNYRVIALGIAVGLISMLIHQIYSLTLRMSVTMTAYFFLLGLGIFMISYSKKALIKPVADEEPSRFRLLFTPIKNNGVFIVFGVIIALIIVGFLNFRPVFRSENYIIRANRQRTLSKANLYIKMAIDKKPDNPYAWTQKWNFDRNHNLKAGKKNDYNEEFFVEIEKDLEKLNEIIPGYQDVWSKYANLYLTQLEHYSRKWTSTKNLDSLKKAQDSIDKAIVNLNKSIDMNFLNDINHIYRLVLLSKVKNKNAYDAAIRDYIECRIYLDYCRKKKIIKERIAIKSGDSSSMTENNDIMEFVIGKKQINELSNKTYSLSGLSDIERIKKILNDEIKKIYTGIYEK